MTYTETYSADVAATGLPGDVAARIVDFVSRKSKSVPERIESLCALIEQKVLHDGVRGGLLSLVRRFSTEFRKETNEELGETEWAILSERIVRYGRGVTIEDYSTYLIELPTGI